jgi:hypothetical protein
MWAGQMNTKLPRKLAAKLLPLVVLILVLPVLLPLLAVHISYSIFLYLSVAACWLPFGKNVLFVYSNSPHWKAYLEGKVLPTIRDRSVVLNWSDRSAWDRWSLPVMCFRHFGGTREFNPMAVVFRPFRKVEVFRFWRAFHDLKHGKPLALQELEKAFFDFLREAA